MGTGRLTCGGWRTEGSLIDAPIVFRDTARPDCVAQAAFYRTVFGWRVSDDGPFQHRRLFTDHRRVYK